MYANWIPFFFPVSYFLPPSQNYDAKINENELALTESVYLFQLFLTYSVWVRNLVSNIKEIT
jgi:hypothetical protein